MYKTILVPHAGTKAGDEALKHAIFAANDTSKIIILHIVEAMQYPPSFALSSSERKSLMKSIDDVNEEMRKDMELKMEKLTQQCKEKSIKSEVKVEIGDAAEIILDAVEKENVDLIVMSKRRKLKGMKKLLSLGSVSRKVVENVTCPVTLIDIEDIWTNKKKIINNTNALKPLSTLEEKNYDRKQLSEANGIMGEAKNVCKEYSVEFNGIATNGIPGNKIVQYAQDNEFDHIVIGMSGKGHVREILLESVSDHVIHHANIPITIVK